MPAIQIAVANLLALHFAKKVLFSIGTVEDHILITFCYCGVQSMIHDKLSQCNTKAGWVKTSFFVLDPRQSKDTFTKHNVIIE